MRREELHHLDRVAHGDAQDPDIGLAAGPDADRTGGQQADRLHLGHPLGLPLDVGHELPDPLDRRVDLDPAADRDADGSALVVDAEPAEPAVEQERAGEPADRRGRQSPDHRSLSRTIATPASIISVTARSPSPGARSTARIAVGQEAGRVAEAGRIERGRPDTVVGGQPADHDPFDVVRPEERVQLGRDLLAAARVAHREPRVAVLAVGALADGRPVDDQARDGARRPTTRPRSGPARRRRPGRSGG